MFCWSELEDCLECLAKRLKPQSSWPQKSDLSGVPWNFHIRHDPYVGRDVARGVEGTPAGQQRSLRRSPAGSHHRWLQGATGTGHRALIARAMLRAGHGAGLGWKHVRWNTGYLWIFKIGNSWETRIDPIWFGLVGWPTRFYNQEFDGDMIESW